MINDNLLSVTGGDLITYLNGSEGTATSINQAWMDYLTREGYTTGTLNDRLFNKLRDDGFTGTLADMLTGFWSTPQVNYVARLDGATQYWQLSEAIALDGGDFKICVSAELKPSIIEIIAGNSSNTSGSIFFDGSKLFIRDTESVVISTEQDVPIKQGVSKICVLRVGGVFSVTVDETEYTMSRSGVVSGGLMIDRLGRYSTNSFIYSGILLDLEIEIDGVITNSIPLTNKAQGATQLATVGNVNATMLNYTEAVWEEG